MTVLGLLLFTLTEHVICQSTGLIDSLEINRTKITPISINRVRQLELNKQHHTIRFNLKLIVIEAYERTEQ